jgi:uncharacterized membrane protein YeaQ/YmgE (transglycosylase-associated protein family)
MTKVTISSERDLIPSQLGWKAWRSPFLPSDFLGYAAMDAAKRNVLILAACQTLYMSGTTLMISTSPLIGHQLAPDPQWATVPLAAHHCGVMAATIPASQIMRFIGRRNGFMMATFFGMIGATIAGSAVLHAWFWVFCLGVFVVGWFNGFAVFYRFAAADISTPEFRPKAISWVLTGGLFAALLGPQLANRTAVARDTRPTEMLCGDDYRIRQLWCHESADDLDAARHDRLWL